MENDECALTQMFQAGFFTSVAITFAAPFGNLKCSRQCPQVRGCPQKESAIAMFSLSSAGLLVSNIK